MQKGLISTLSAWSFQKQNLNRPTQPITAVLKKVIAVYSPHPTTALSLIARTASFSKADFKALEASQEIIRMPAMRLSVHLTLKEYASKIFAATVPPKGDYWDKRYSQKGRDIPTEKYALWIEEILAFTQTPQPAKAIKAACSIPDDTLKKVLNRMCFERYLLRIGADSLRSNIIQYVSAESWLGKAISEESEATSLTWLAKEYFNTFGPARIKDFQWWAGITMGKAKAAVSSLDLSVIDESQKLLILTSELDHFKQFKFEWSPEMISILPQWDCYTMGYAPDGRARFVSDEGQKIIYGKLGATLGNGLGTILLNGMAVASWAPKFKGNKMAVSIQAFEKLSETSKSNISGYFESIAPLLDAKTVELSGL